MNSGWIKIYAEFQNWEWYRNNNTKSLFIHCLLKANWREGKFEGQIIPRGSFVTSIDSLKKELGMTTQEIRTAIKHLISTNEITSKSCNKFRIITITNYELYQEPNKQINNQLTSEQQATNKQLTTIEDISIYISSYLERIYARTITSYEYEKIISWLKEYDKELIKYAICVSVENNKKNLKYVNGILRNWKSAGFKTIEDVKANEIKFEEEKNKPKEELFDYDWLNGEDNEI